MASGSSGTPYDQFENDSIEQDLIDPDDGMTIVLHEEALDANDLRS